jgi:hypothetical protein
MLSPRVRNPCVMLILRQTFEVQINSQKIAGLFATTIGLAFAAVGFYSTSKRSTEKLARQFESTGDAESANRSRSCRERAGRERDFLSRLDIQLSRTRGLPALDNFLLLCSQLIERCFVV